LKSLIKLLHILLLVIALVIPTACSYSYPSEPDNDIMFIPLDDRPVNYAHVIELAGLADNDLRYPSIDILKQRPELAGWIKANSTGAAAAVVSIDMLVYGGLVESRKHQHDTDELYSRLNLAKELPVRGPVWAFVSIMRTPAANTLHTMPDYYGVYGEQIYKYSTLSDKINSGTSEPGDQEKLNQLLKSIPGPYLEDYIARRDKNHQVNCEVLQLVQQGFIDYLVVSSDDTSPYGFSRAEREKLISLAQRYGIKDKVVFFPGTDECGMLLLAAAVNKTTNNRPTVFVNFAQPSGANLIQPYEDIPLDENIRRHILAAGATQVNSAQEADLILAVHNQAAQGDELALTVKSKDADFVEQISYYLTLGKPVAVADVKYPNSADPDLMRKLDEAIDLSSLAGYSGWNTAGNTIGMALSQGIMHRAGNTAGQKIKEKHRLVLLTRMLEDWGYQATVRPEIKQQVPPEQTQLFTNSDTEAKITLSIEEKLNIFAENNLGDFGAVQVTGVKLPWHRLFDIDFAVGVDK